MAEKSVTAFRSCGLPSIDALRDPAVVCDVAAELWALARPISADFLAMTQGAEDGDRIAAAHRIVAQNPPAAMFDFPAALRRAAQAQPDLNLTAREVAKVIDTRTGYRPPDTEGYTLSIINSLQKRSPAVVRLACETLRETDPAEFHHQLPSEAHFIAACDRAQSQLELLPDAIERAERATRQEHEVIAREPQIEAERAERDKRAIARMAQLKAEAAQREAAQQRKREQHEQLLADIDARVESGELKQWMADLLRRHWEVRDDPEWQERVEAELHAAQSIAASTPRGARMMDDARATMTRKLLERRPHPKA